MIKLFHDLVTEFETCEGGNSAFKFSDGDRYDTDTGYALEGIHYFVDRLEKKLGKMTNGEVIKAVFPNIEWTGNCQDVDFYMLDGNTPYSAKMNTFRSWWNASYNGGNNK